MGGGGEWVGGAATDDERSLHSGNPFTHILPHAGEIPEESGRVPALLVFALPNELEGVGSRWGGETLWVVPPPNTHTHTCAPSRIRLLTYYKKGREGEGLMTRSFSAVATGLVWGGGGVCGLGWGGGGR